jgi:magnesium-transporting ATPase (P-type)
MVLLISNFFIFSLYFNIFSLFVNLAVFITFIHILYKIYKPGDNKDNNQSEGVGVGLAENNSDPGNSQDNFIPDFSKNFLAIIIFLILSCIEILIVLLNHSNSFISHSNADKIKAQGGKNFEVVFSYMILCFLVIKTLYLLLIFYNFREIRRDSSNLESR